MKANKNISLFFLCMFYLTNSIHSQSYLWKDNGSGGNGHSIVYEFLDGNGISKIGIGTENPSAKFHLQATPTTSSPTAKFDWISTGSTVLGSIEHWHFNGGTMYYGIYQPQPQPNHENYLSPAIVAPLRVFDPEAGITTVATAIRRRKFRCPLSRSHPCVSRRALRRTE